MYRATNNLLPVNIQACFFQREGGYNLRGELKLKHLYARTTLKTFCISVCGVKLWNRLAGELLQQAQQVRLKTNQVRLLSLALPQSEPWSLSETCLTPPDPWCYEKDAVSLCVQPVPLSVSAYVELED